MIGKETPVVGHLPIAPNVDDETRAGIFWLGVRSPFLRKYR